MAVAPWIVPEGLWERIEAVLPTKAPSAYPTSA